MTNPNRKCNHGYAAQRCPMELCEFASKLEVNDPARFFGRDSASVEAQALFVSDPVRYRRLRDLAKERKLIA